MLAPPESPDKATFTLIPDMVNVCADGTGVNVKLTVFPCAEIVRPGGVVLATGRLVVNVGIGKVVMLSGDAAVAVIATFGG